MSRRPIHALGDEALGRALAGLDLAWPEAPEDLASGVLVRIRADRPAPARRSRTRIVLLVAAAILLLASAAVAARLVFDLGAITIEPVPTDHPLPTTSAIPELGRVVPLARAEELTGTEASVPAALGQPDRVWVDAPEDQPPGAPPTRIVMAWEPRPGLPSIPGSPYGAIFIRWDAYVGAGVKLVGHEIEPVTVEGWPDAFWVADPHELVLFTDEGPIRLLVRGDVLLWGDGSTTFRLENALPRREAVAIANSTP